MDNETPICEDPYWTNCTEEGTYHKIDGIRVRPDSPICLCEACYNAQVEAGTIDETEWE